MSLQRICTDPLTVDYALRFIKTFDDKPANPDKDAERVQVTFSPVRMKQMLQPTMSLMRRCSLARPS